jgi:hypothetical protein
MVPTDTFRRRKLVRLLDAEDLSRREQVRALARIEGISEWMLNEALRSGLETSRLETAIARLGTGWARRAVKRFYLSVSTS